MRSPRSRNAAPSSPSDDDRCRAGGGVGGVATGDDAARGGIESSEAGGPDADCDVEHAALCVGRQYSQAYDRRAFQRVHKYAS